MNISQQFHSRPVAGLMVVIATAGGNSKLRETLTSLAACDRPDSFLKVVVIENGEPLGASNIVADYSSEFPIEYLYAPQANKSAALNVFLGVLEQNTLLFLTDDDISFESGVLTAMWEAARGSTTRVVFGGRLKVRTVAPPPRHLQGFLPQSMVGYPRPGERVDPANALFLGANWAAFSDDLSSLGGFDPRFGPGSKLNATGQETEMMWRMRKAGFHFCFVEEAVVWHHVDASRLTVSFLAKRRYRYGVATGMRVRAENDAAGTCLPLGRLLGIRLKVVAKTLLSQATNILGCKDSSIRLLISAHQLKGFLKGYRSEDVVSNPGADID